MRKRICAALMALTMTLSLLPLPGLAAEDPSYTVDGITYVFDVDPEAGTAELTDVIAEGEEEVSVTVPETVEYQETTYTITTAYFSMWGTDRENIAQIVLPDTVVDITGSFSKFPNLTEITIPGSVTVFNASFQNMKNLESITFEEGVEEIGQSAGSMVSNCTALTDIHLPDSMKLISANSAFSDAPALTTINLPDGLTFASNTLGHFSRDTSLTEITLPASMTEIPQGMFSDCTSLTAVNASSPITKVGPSAFSGATNLTTIPDLDQVTEIGSYAFNECEALTGPVDLSNVTEIGGHAFYECNSLPGPIDLGSVTKVGSYAFYACYSLTGELDLSNLTEIPDSAFRFAGYWRDGISLTLGPNLTSIGPTAFPYVPITELVLPESLTEIGNYAFDNCTKLTGDVVIPDSVTSIGKNAFSGTAIETLTIGSGIEEIGENAFAIESLASVTIHSSEDAIDIAENAFPDTVKEEIQFTVPSIGKEIDDTISGEDDSLTLQEAVTAAAESETGGTVTLKKHVRLDKPVNVPAGQKVTITAEGDETFWILAREDSSIRNLFTVEAGAQVEFTGNLVLSGRYHTGGVVDNKGTVILSGDAVVQDSKITGSSSGVINTYGEGAKFVMEGGSVRENEIDTEGQYNGIVRIAYGAVFEMSGGSIAENSAEEADYLNNSSGVLLQGKASGTMAGGNISNNQGIRGTAIYLRGDYEFDPETRTRFTLKEGLIQGNRSTTDIHSSGAVYIENNATFFMDGGTITDNHTFGSTYSGGAGGGVCVVDSGLKSIEKIECKTEFIMNGGEISNNSALKGGGVYSFTNSAVLNAGTIKGNHAADHGGGVYSEGNYDSYSTLHLGNALVTGNTAQQGGGMWFCATGETTVYVTEGAAIFDNTAEDDHTLPDLKGAGDDFVFTSPASESTHSATLAERMLGGGAVQWMKDGRVTYSALSEGVVPSTDPDTPRYGQEGAEQEPVHLQNASGTCYALKAITTEEAKELARKEATLIITDNTAAHGGGIGANGGIIIGTRDTTEVEVVKKWENDTESDRPAFITVNLLNGETVIDTAELTAENGWTHTFTELPTQDGNGQDYVYEIQEVQVNGYETGITSSENEDGFIFTITNTKTEEPGEPEGPGDPDGPDDPDDPDDPDVPDQPDKPDRPDTPDEPDGPDEPDTPDEPDGPDEPDTPDEPDSPDEPDTPDEPDGPDVPDTPDEPDVPDVPEEPGTDIPDDTPPETGVPGGPDEPGEPGQPDEPSLPQTGQLWWPVGLLAISGALLVLLGIWNRMRYRGKHEA